MNKAPRLKADFNSGEGHVVFPNEWEELTPLMRADLLKDWIDVLSARYQIAIEEAFPR